MYIPKQCPFVLTFGFSSSFRNHQCSFSFYSVSPLTTTIFVFFPSGDYLIAVPPINQTVMENDPAHFPCVTKDRTSTVTWFKDGIDLSELHELLLRVIISPEGSLTISSTRMSDLGEYSCNVQGVDGDEQKTTAFLNVQCIGNKISQNFKFLSKRLFSR